MISHRHKCIFVHLRRTGGNSIEAALGGIKLYDRDGNPTNVWDNEIHRASRKYKEAKRGHYIHDTALVIRDKFPKHFDRYFKFSVVRNPWEQMLSLFRRQTGAGSVDEFVNFLKKFKLHDGTVPRVSLHDDGGALLIDHVVRFEELESGFRQVCQKIGLDDIVLPHFNASAGHGYREFYNAEAKTIVKKMFAEDTERYCYEF